MRRWTTQTAPSGIMISLRRPRCPNSLNAYLLEYCCAHLWTVTAIVKLDDRFYKFIRMASDGPEMQIACSVAPRESDDIGGILLAIYCTPVLRQLDDMQVSLSRQTYRS